jgi:hypothetical protein
MGKIQINDSQMDVIVKMANGNPGCLSFIIGLLSNHDKIDPQAMLGGMGVLMIFDDMGLYGTDIYVLYKDKCGEDIRKVVMLLRAAQLGFYPRSKIIEMAKDQMRKICITKEELDSLDQKVCEKLEQFMKPKEMI